MQDEIVLVQGADGSYSVPGAKPGQAGQDMTDFARVETADAVNSSDIFEAFGLWLAVAAPLGIWVAAHI